jgi:arginine/lysine/ornithine decarboxylase
LTGGAGTVVEGGAAVASGRQHPLLPGRVAAEIISPYPPGIPAIAAGELITTDLLEALRDEARAGSRMAGASDPTLETVLVVRS